VYFEGKSKEQIENQMMKDLNTRAEEFQREAKRISELDGLVWSATTDVPPRERERERGRERHRHRQRQRQGQRQRQRQRQRDRESLKAKKADEIGKLLLLWMLIFPLDP
jgi:hypothetical protein